MKVMKRIIIGVLIVALVAGGTYGGLMHMKKSKVVEVPVTSVSNLMTDYYSDTTLDGTITTNVTQNINMDKDMIIDQIYVAEGDNVNKGDPLISFDMTLVEMELNIAKLKLQKQEQDLVKAQNRLTSLQNGGPIEDTTDTTADDGLDSVSGDDSTDSTSAGDSSMSDSGISDSAGDDDLEAVDTSSLDSGMEGNYLAAAIQPVILAAVFADNPDPQPGAQTENTEVESSQAEDTAVTENETADTAGGDISEDISQAEDITPSEDNSSEDKDMDNTDEEPDDSGLFDGPSYQDPSAGDLTDGETPDINSGSDDTPKVSVTPTPTPKLGPNDLPDPTVNDPEIPGISDGEPVFYQKLDYTSEPFAGTGTKEDPYIFMVSSAKRQVTVMGSFFNKMAGYSEDGTKVEKEGGSWFQLEFHENDTITDFQNRRESCTGYYLVDGSLLEKPVYMYVETVFTLDEASQYDKDTDDDIPDDSGSDDGGDPTPTMTREEAIKAQQSKIASLKLDIEESNLKITKLERKVQNKVVYSKLDGTVAYVGDAATGSYTGDAFLKVKSKDGFYVTGTVSELMLDDMKEGTVLQCTSYESGSFEATVLNVSDYPVNSSSYFYYGGDSNPNVSYYTFSAEITDRSLKFTDQDYVTINLKSNTLGKGNYVIMKAFIRTENGSSYVYKDDNGVLKKQSVKLGAIVNSGYYAIVKSGLKSDDMLAFPYGDNLKDGTKTKEVTLDEMYGE